MSAETVQAELDLFHFDGKFHETGEVVGDCIGTITGIDLGDYVADVKPSPDVCQHCPLSEYCTQSKAD